VADGLTRLGSSVQEVGVDYETADSVPVNFDMRLRQDATTGQVDLSYSFVNADNGQETHAYRQFSHNEDGSVSIQSHEVAVSETGNVQTSTQYFPEEAFDRGGYAAAEKRNTSRPLSEPSEAWISGMAAARAPAAVAPGDVSEMRSPSGQQQRLQDRVSEAMGGLPADAPQQSIEERVAGMDTQAAEVLGLAQADEGPLNAAVPRVSGGGGGMPMQMPAMPPLQTPQPVSPQLLQSAAPPEGYGESGSLADKLMTALVMDELMDDSPLNRLGGSGGGGFSGDTPRGVGTMDLSDSMQTLTFPGQEVLGTAPQLEVDPAQENPLAGIEEEFFEHPREMNIGNVNPLRAKKE